MSPQHHLVAEYLLFARHQLRPPSNQTVAEWCCENVKFDEAEYRGPFEIARAEYLREPLNLFADNFVRDVVLCWGSQAKKTGLLMGGAMWSIQNSPSGIFWVMATVPLARTFSKQRLLKMIKKTMPADAPDKGGKRHKVNILDMEIGASQINIVGSNSPAALSSTPARRIILDEVDKFDEGGKGEADAVNLAEQRTKNVSCPQRWKTSTPTLYTGLIWQEFLKGDQRRYFVACPHCSQEIVFAWSRDFTVFKITGAEAFVKWDQSARTKDGWNEDAVKKSAHAECPYCAGEIRDGHKTRMVREGIWKASATSASTFRSYHLPSMYACAPETTFGAMAVRFLQSKKSVQGLQGFINGDLAEPYQSQDMMRKRTELITDRVKIEVNSPWTKLLTLDCQERAPLFWHVGRAWRGGESEAFSAGPLDSWEQAKEIQKAHGIADVCCAVDSGYGAKDDAEVYLNCALSSEFVPQSQGPSLAVGWLPTKGMPSRKRWKHEDGIERPWYLSHVDPFGDSSEAGKTKMSLLEFSADHFKDVLHRLRAQRHGRWSVKSEVSNDEYWRHLDAWIRTEVRNRRGSQSVVKWVLRDQHWPDHMGDCEVLQIVLATFHQILSE